ncbi:MAG: carbon-nitrogen hydrolase family protein [Alphaproteobacteria bacterium]|nr:carbon-nitrogen hydrolase family protein [Alphaproteobacteria bacterium]
MVSTLRVACVQVNAGNDMPANITVAVAGVRAAAADGAGLITLPENAVMIAANGRETRANARTESEHPGLTALRDAAAATGRWVLIGSLAIATASGKVANRSFLVDDRGEIVARYDKIHMFDVELPNGESYRESANFEPGAAAAIAPSPWGLIGLTICYDLRFPYLYRGLAHAGARLLTVPSAFTRVTGAAHWHVLLRARAIECGAFVIAPAQTGDHPGKRQTYGHSLVVGPWGEVLLDAETAPGMFAVDIELDRIDEARRSIPSLQHDRSYGAATRLKGVA